MPPVTDSWRGNRRVGGVFNQSSLIPRSRRDATAYFEVTASMSMVVFLVVWRYTSLAPIGFTATVSQTRGLTATEKKKKKSGLLSSVSGGAEGTVLQPQILNRHWTSFRTRQRPRAPTALLRRTFIAKMAVGGRSRRRPRPLVAVGRPGQLPRVLLRSAPAVPARCFP